MKRRRRDRTPRSTKRDSVPFDGMQTASGIAGYEAGNGIAHGLMAVVIALVLAILFEPIRRALRAWFRQ